MIAGPTADGWYQIERGGQVGWLHGWFLLVDGTLGWSAPPPPAGPEPPAAVDPQVTIPIGGEPALDPASAAELGVGGPGTGWGAGTAYVGGDLGLNVRAAPEQGAGIVGVAGPGEAVTVTGEPVNGYVPISSWLGPGWVWGELLSYQSTAMPPAPGIEPPVAEAPVLDAPAPSAERWVQVNRSSQTVTLFEGDQVVATYWGAMGSDPSADGFFSTAVGTYWVYEKFADLSWTPYANAWVRHWVGFDPARYNGFHSYTMDWNGQVLAGGAGPTGGCVALEPGAAAALFDFVQVGTRVEVVW